MDEDRASGDPRSSSSTAMIAGTGRLPEAEARDRSNSPATAAQGVLLLAFAEPVGQAFSAAAEEAWNLWRPVAGAIDVQVGPATPRSSEPRSWSSRGFQDGSADAAARRQGARRAMATWESDLRRPLMIESRPIWPTTSSSPSSPTYPPPGLQIPQLRRACLLRLPVIYLGQGEPSETSATSAVEDRPDHILPLNKNVAAARLVGS